MKFIEGPYVADPEFGSITCPTGDLARVYSPPSWVADEETYINTVHLLAASLRMYKALVDLVNAWPEDDCDKLRAAAAALAKAEGRTHAPTD